MTGIVVATHGDFGNALVSTLKMILGSTDGIESIALLSEDSMESFKAKMEGALQTVDPEKKGALVLVDMLGGTPFNVSIQLAQIRKLQVVTGVNLPMLVKVASGAEEADLEVLAQDVQKATRESIVTSVELFKK